MRILIQNVESRKYLAGVRKCVGAVRHAKDFAAPVFAYEVGRKLMAGRFRVVLHFPKSGQLVDFMEGTGQSIRPAAA
jgi:hypothetical protein